MKNTSPVTRPLLDECAPYYHSYINEAPGDDALAALQSTLESTTTFLGEIPLQKWDFRYAPGKWSLKESFIHLLDAERIFAYRALRISRNDQTPLPGFNQDEYIPYYHADQRSSQSIIDEYRSIRQATITLFQNLDADSINRRGIASGNSITVRALAYIILGHEQHHLKLAREKYL